MEKKAELGMMLTLLLASILTSALEIRQAKGWTGRVHIEADGSIDPSDAPISSADNVTYVFEGSFSGSIVVERDDVIIDGAACTLQGSGSRGIDLIERANVTVQNIRIRGFYCGIWVHDSSNNSIIGNHITANDGFGIMLNHSSGNIFSRNNITANNYNGIVLCSSSDQNSICGNNIIDNGLAGLLLDRSSSNILVENNIADNDVGIGLMYSSGNSFYHNLFINNFQQVSIEPSEYANVWDDGYPSGGNYWSDYAGIDEDKDGFGDTLYVIDAQNVDHYPLISIPPFLDTGPPIVSIKSPRPAEIIWSSTVTVSWQGTDYASGISRYSVTIDGGQPIDVGLNTSITLTELDDGEHVVMIVAFDNAGHSAYQPLYFTVNAGARLSWTPYIAKAVVTIAMVVTLGIALYVLKRRYSSGVRKPDRRLIR